MQRKLLAIRLGAKREIEDRNDLSPLQERRLTLNNRGTEKSGEILGTQSHRYLSMHHLLPTGCTCVHLNPSQCAHADGRCARVRWNSAMNSCSLGDRLWLVPPIMQPQGERRRTNQRVDAI